ncbi:MAG: ATP-binding protein [Rhodocyclaceae bacterium]|nr:ATP-binding protein [Rhodocyclaceae bacterium]MDQ7999499.1 ATP-binding protein [Pseudomonadota bacterium]
MRTAEPSPPPADAAADRFLVECEVLRLSTRPLGPVLAVQFLLNAGVAAVFGWLYSPARAALWLAGIAAVTVMRGFFPQRVPDTLTPETLRRAQRVHTLRTGLWEAAHGLAGVLLFNAADPMHQLLLGLIVMGMTLSSAFSVSFHTPAVRLAITLLMAPVIAMGLAFGAPPMVAVALLGVLLLALMLKQVGSHNRQLEENIGLRLNAHALREQALAGLRESQQAQAERLRFFSAANHDLRQPVMAIGLQTAVLREQLDQGAPAAAVQGTVAALADAQAALETLTHQLLEIGRIEAGVEALVRAAVPLAALLADVARQAGGTRIHVRCPADATAWSDAVALRRILANLVDNAVKFAPRGRILLAARRRAGAWRVEVRDGGIGIAPEAQARVFGDFEQVGNVERNLQRGHGLGLGVVRRLADRLDLRITLRSAAGRGAVFGFTVPAAPADAPVADRPALRHIPPAATPAQPLRPGIEVLVVEDNAVVAASLVALLRQWSARAQVYASAAEALALADLRRIQVALCDIRLPGELDGVALAERLQAHRPGLVIALVSADIDEATQAHARARGWQALRKPVQPAALRAVLAQAG